MYGIAEPDSGIISYNMVWCTVKANRVVIASSTYYNYKKWDIRDTDRYHRQMQTINEISCFYRLWRSNLEG